MNRYHVSSYLYLEALRHSTKAKQFSGSFPQDIAELFQKPLPVLVVIENLPAFFNADNDLMHRPRRVDAGFALHEYPNTTNRYQLKILASNWVAMLIFQGLLSLLSSSAAFHIFFFRKIYLDLSRSPSYQISQQCKCPGFSSGASPGKAGSLPKCNQYINTRYILK